MSRNRRNPQPLTSARLEELGLAYVARFATTRARLEGYLARKVRERGWDGEGEVAARICAIGDKFESAGYIDDAVYARMKTGSLLRRGYGMRRVGEALRAAGVDPELRDSARTGEAELRQAVLVLARRRRFGPFGSELPDRPLKEKQVAAMLRAGHALDKARAIVDANDPAELEEWAESAIGDEHCD